MRLWIMDYGLWNGVLYRPRWQGTGKKEAHMCTCSSHINDDGIGLEEDWSGMHGARMAIESK
jgi:hypothetical protein